MAVWSYSLSFCVAGVGSNCGERAALSLDREECAGGVCSPIPSDRGVRKRFGFGSTNLQVQEAAKSAITRQFIRSVLPKSTFQRALACVSWILLIARGKMGFQSGSGSFGGSTTVVTRRVYSAAG